MTFRDDQDAMLARLSALDTRVASFDQELAVRDEQLAAARIRITELEQQVEDLQRELGNSEASLRDVRRQREIGKPSAEIPFVPGSADAHAQVERFLEEGIALHHTGDRREATARFRAGLNLVQGHPELVRALRRYT